MTKNTKIVAKESVKMTQRAVQISKRTIQATIQATIKTLKAIITTAKAIISAIIAGGWVAVVIILVIALIGGFIAAIFNSNGDTDYDTSQIPNSEIILVAKAQIGNEGGDKFWKWYGFEEHVHSFYEIRIKYNLSEQEKDRFLELTRTRLQNDGYNVYFTNTKFVYNNANITVQPNELIIAIKENNI